MARLARATAPLRRRDNAERRRAPRVDFGRPGTVRIGDDLPVEALVSDLTREGCRLVVDAALAPGQEVQVGIAHLGLIAGQVVWQGTYGYGCKFNVPLASGAVTRASGPSNVTTLPGIMSDTSHLSAPVKMGPRTQLAVIVGASILGWGVLAAFGVLLLR